MTDCLPDGPAALDGPALLDDLRAQGVVELQILLFGLPLGTLLFLKQLPVGAGLVTALMVGRAIGLTGQHRTHPLHFQNLRQAASQPEVESALWREVTSSLFARSGICHRRRVKQA